MKNVSAKTAFAMPWYLTLTESVLLFLMHLCFFLNTVH